jgi:peptide methionine sulfoxide reductase MsrB
MINDRRAFLQTAALAGVALLAPVQPAAALEVGGKMRLGDESIMSPKGHGTSSQPVQSDLLYGVSNKLADKICNFNRHFAEMGGSFQSTDFEDVVRSANGPVTFYDSVTGKPLFVAPLSRSAEAFVAESKIHGWPSFRDDEVVWDNVRVLKNSGETVSVDGTHLGHNLPDKSGNRYCINLVSIAGKPTAAPG